MNRLIGIAGLILLGLFALHSFAPVVGYEDGILGGRLLAALALALLPLGAVMAVYRNRVKRREREEKRHLMQQEYGRNGRKGV